MFIEDLRFKASGFQGLGFGASGLRVEGFRVSGFRVWGFSSGLRVEGRPEVEHRETKPYERVQSTPGLKAQGLGFRV